MATAEQTVAHTPAPWQVGKRNIAEVDGWRFYRYPISGSGMAIAAVWAGSVDRSLGLSNGEANAHLIAAAPDLLAACKEQVAECPRCHGSGRRGDEDLSVAAHLEHGMDCPDCRKARAAIAKAESA